MHECGRKTSLAAIEWLEYENRHFAKKASCGFEYNQIQHAFNGRGEKKIGNYHLDGYVEWETEANGHVWIGYEFFGCRFHQCPHNCGVTSMQSNEEYEKEQKRLDFLRRNLTRLVVIYECEWNELKKTIREEERKTKTKILVSRVSRFLSQRTVSENQILTAVANGSFYGLLCVDISTPADVIEKYENLNFPLIFNDLKVTEEMLSAENLEMARARGIKFPYQAKTLTWNASGFIGTTPLLKFYLDLGMKLSNVRWAMQFQAGAPFSGFVEMMVKERIKAKIDGNDPAGDRAKFVLNSAVARDFIYFLSQIFNF